MCEHPAQCEGQQSNLHPLQCLCTGGHLLHGSLHLLLQVRCRIPIIQNVLFSILCYCAVQNGAQLDGSAAPLLWDHVSAHKPPAHSLCSFAINAMSDLLHGFSRQNRQAEALRRKLEDAEAWMQVCHWQVSRSCGHWCLESPQLPGQGAAAQLEDGGCQFVDAGRLPLLVCSSSQCRALSDRCTPHNPVCNASSSHETLHSWPPCPLRRRRSATCPPTCKPRCGDTWCKSGRRTPASTTRSSLTRCPSSSGGRGGRAARQTGHTPPAICEGSVTAVESGIICEPPFATQICSCAAGVRLPPCLLCKQSSMQGVREWSEWAQPFCQTVLPTQPDAGGRLCTSWRATRCGSPGCSTCWTMR